MKTFKTGDAWFRTLAAVMLVFLLTAPSNTQPTQPAATRSLDVGVEVEDGTKQVFYKGSYALLIGVSNYDTTGGWRKLPGVAQDMTEVRKALVAHGFQIEEEIDPTREKFDRVVRRFISRYGLDPDNRLLIYFAGHGATLKSPDGVEYGYIVPGDAPRPDRQEGEGPFIEKAVSMKEMLHYADEIRSKHALFVFDSCFSGSLFYSSMFVVPNYTSSKNAARVRQFITAGGADQVVPDQSIFREQFVKALMGDADLDHNQYVTGTELGLFINNEVTKLSKAQTPLWGKMGDPANRGDFIFALSSQSRAKPSDTVGIEALKRQLEDAGVEVSNAELRHWMSIANSTAPEDYREYLAKYPNGAFAKTARKRAGQQPAPGRISLLRAGEEEEAARSRKPFFITASFTETNAAGWLQNSRPASSNNLTTPENMRPALSPNESWYVILGSYPLTRQDKANALLVRYQAKGYDARLINSNWGDFPNFARGLWVIVVGPSTQREARNVSREIRTQNRFASRKDRPYIKQAVK